jgi:cytochrome c553
MITFCLALAGSGTSYAASPQETAAAKCEGCHGAGGNSPPGNVPRLNGQHAEYLFSRVRSFRNLTRQSPHATEFMWSVNASLSDADLRALAGYFAAQPATAPASSGAGAERGRSLYQNGAGQRLPSCQGCHGAQGEGRGLVPRLAGQHGEYLRQQMGNFMSLMRIHGPMQRNTNTITAAEVDDLVAYLARD